MIRPVKAKSKPYRFTCTPPCCGEICPGHEYIAYYTSEKPNAVLITLRNLDSDAESVATEYARPQLQAMMSAFENGKSAFGRKLQKEGELSRVGAPRYAWILNLTKRTLHSSLDGGKTGRDSRCQLNKVSRGNRKRFTTIKAAKAFCEERKWTMRLCPQCMGEQARREAKLAEAEMHAGILPAKTESEVAQSDNTFDLSDQAAFDPARVN